MLFSYKYKKRLEILKHNSLGTRFPSLRRYAVSSLVFASIYLILIFDYSCFREKQGAS